mgnify:CR=1 FL=1
MCICCVAQHMRCSAVLSKFAAQCQASDHTKISSELFGHLSNIKPCDCSATNCLAISTWGGGVQLSEACRQAAAPHQHSTT